jgi:hypothetical protein
VAEKVAPWLAAHQSFGRSGKDPKNVSVLTCPLALSRVVTVVTCSVWLMVTTRSLETSVSMKPTDSPLLSLLMIMMILILRAGMSLG